MDKFDPASHNITEENKKQLKHLFPEAFTEQRIDFDRLKTLLGEVVETGPERYSFNWPGKTEAIRAAQLSSMGTLVPDKESSVDWDTTQNLYLEGDNLEILKLLQKSYTGKVKMIYIDPPYNTGKDFIYPDKYGEGLKTYLEYTGQIDGEGKKLSTNTETDGRYHSKWLNMMYPRLMLARNLLKDDGVIYISIDDHELVNLKRICDEVFGAENYIEIFSRVKTETPSNLSEKTKQIIEYVLAYQKSSKLDGLRGLSKSAQSSNPLLNQSNAEKELVFPPNVVLTSMKDQVIDPGEYGTDSYKVELLESVEIRDGVFVSPIRLRGKFRWTQNYLANEISSGTVIAIPTRKLVPTYERADYGREVPPNLIDYKVGAETNEQASTELDELMGGKYFEYPKPVSLVTYLINTCCDSDSIILDFFAGSSTTAHAVMKLNAEDGGTRRYAVAQLQEPTPEDSKAKKAGFKDITEIGRERIKRAGAKIREENAEKIAARETPLDTGFKTYRLTESTFNVWDVKKEDDFQQKLVEATSLIKGDAKEEDVLTELILKSGYGLTEKVEEMKIEGKKIYSIAGGLLVVSLDTGLTLTIVRAIADRKPSQFVAREHGFSSDDALTNTAQIMKDKGIDFRVL